MRSRPLYWVEDQKEPLGVRPATLGEGEASLRNRAARQVARDEIDGMLISTIFLAVDHSYASDPNVAPVLYETMVFSQHGQESVDSNRYHTRAEAQAGHAEIVAKYRQQATS